MTTPLTLEQRILIAAEYNADRVEMIKGIIEDEAKRFYVFSKCEEFKQSDNKYTVGQIYTLYKQSNKQVNL